jgi:rhodanese-related sulfurtransferase
MIRVTAAIVVCALAVFPAGNLRAGSAPVSSAPKAAENPVHKKIDDERSLRPEEAKKLIDRDRDLLVIYVRSPSEFGQGGLEGSRNIPFISILEGRHTLPRNRPILLVCSIGGRSYAAAQILLERGYRKVFNLDGGLAAWQKAGLPASFQGIITR